MKLYLHRIGNRIPADIESVSTSVGSDRCRKRIHGSHLNRARDASVSSKGVKTQASVSSRKRDSLSSMKNTRITSSGKSTKSVSSTKSKKSFSSTKSKQYISNDEHFKLSFVRLNRKSKPESTTANDHSTRKSKSNSNSAEKTTVRTSKAKLIDVSEDRNVFETMKIDVNDETREDTDLIYDDRFEVPACKELDAPASYDWIFGWGFFDSTDGRKNDDKQPDQDVASNSNSIGLDSNKSGKMNFTGPANTIFDKLGAIFQGQSVNKLEVEIADESQDVEMLSEKKQSTNADIENVRDSKTHDIVEDSSAKKSIVNNAAVTEIKVTIDVRGCGCLQSPSYPSDDELDTHVIKKAGKSRDDTSNPGSIDWDVKSAQDTVFSYEGESDQGNVSCYDDKPVQPMVFPHNKSIQEPACSVRVVGVEQEPKCFGIASVAASTDECEEQECQGTSPAKDDCTVIEPAAEWSNADEIHVFIHDGDEEGFEVNTLEVKKSDSSSQVSDMVDAKGEHEKGNYENEEEVPSREENPISKNNHVGGSMCSCFDALEYKEWSRKDQCDAVELATIISNNVFQNGVHAVKEATLVVRNNADGFYKTLDKLDDDQTARSASTPATKVTFASNGTDFTDTSSCSRATICTEKIDGNASRCGLNVAGHDILMRSGEIVYNMVGDPDTETLKLIVKVCEAGEGVGQALKERKLLH